MKKFLNKETILIIFLFIAIFSFVNIKPLDDLDELWNYNAARNILDGLLPYKEFSIIVTPITSMVSSIFLWLLGNELIVMRVITAILFTGMFYTTFKIFQKLFCKTFSQKINCNGISLLYTLILFYIYIDNFRIDYNFFSVFLILIILNIELKFINKNNLANRNKTKIKNNVALENETIVKNNIAHKNETIIKNNVECENTTIIQNMQDKKLTNLLIGILLGAVVLTKQSVGVIACIIGTFYIFLLCKNKQELKKALKIFAIRILGIAIVGIIFLIYLICNNLIYDFIDYAVLGITTFTNKIQYSTLMQNENLHVKILSVISPIIIVIVGIYLLIKILKKKSDKVYNLLILFVYSLVPIILVFPISDEVHFIAGGYVIFILELYICTNIIKWIYCKIKLKHKSDISTFLLILSYTMLVLLTLSYTISNYYLYFTNKDINLHINHYKGIIIGEGLKKKIEEVDNFIIQNKEKGIKVYILDAESCVYNIPLDIYIKDYDMFLIGNLGKNGVEEKLEEIKSLRESGRQVFLVRNPNYSLNWQTPMEIINYVRGNLEKIEEVSIFDVYK